MWSTGGSGIPERLVDPRNRAMESQKRAVVTSIQPSSPLSPNAFGGVFKSTVRVQVVEAAAWPRARVHRSFDLVGFHTRQRKPAHERRLCERPIGVECDRRQKRRGCPYGGSQCPVGLRARSAERNRASRIQPAQNRFKEVGTCEDNVHWLIRTVFRVRARKTQNAVFLLRFWWYVI